MTEDLCALELLKDEMRSDEVHLKVNAIHRLKTVIISIGEEKASSNLTEYVEGLISMEDDEVLFAIAEELGMCWELIPEKTLFLPLLEKLCNADETVVREQAYQSMGAISGSLSDSEIQNSFAPIVIRLASSERFYGRVSACHLFAQAYKKANGLQDRLRKKFVALCQEDTCIIRRACALKLGEFSTYLDKKHVI